MNMKHNSENIDHNSENNNKGKASPKSINNGKIGTIFETFDKEPKRTTEKNHTKEIDRFVEKALNDYSEEDVQYLKHRLDEEGIIISFREPIFDSCQCCLCYKHAEEGTISSCGHLFCNHCIKHWLQHSSLCPICQSQISESNFTKLRNLTDTAPQKVSVRKDQYTNT